MHRLSILTGSLLITTAIILGAMAAHALEKILTVQLLDSFEKAVQYHFIAGFSLLIVGLNADKFNFRLTWFFRLIVIGFLLFSCCIYVYCFHEKIPALKPFVYIVPVGGLSFILGWAILFIQILNAKK